MSSYSEFLASTRRGGPAEEAASTADITSSSSERQKVYFRVVHAFVWVRAASALDAEIVGRKFRGQTLCCLEGSRLWAEVVEPRGFVLIDGAALGLGPLLERITIREHEASLAAATEQRRATEVKIEVRVTIEAVVAATMAQLPDTDRAQVRKEAASRVIASTMAQAHHDATRGIRGKAAAGAQNASADALVRAFDLARKLDDDGFAVIEAATFLKIDPARLRTECERIDHLGKLEQTIQAANAIRDDKVTWLTPARATELGCPTIARVIEVQRGLAHALSCSSSTSSSARWRRSTLSVPESTMLACYGASGKYRKHSDNSIDDRDGLPLNARSLTVILYANPDWDVERDGGALRLYRDAGYVDVSPNAGRLVIFDSFRQHEVCESHRDRFALTFWIYADYDAPGASCI